jgi:hypothetical protein
VKLQSDLASIKDAMQAYRTSRQIRKVADRLLPSSVRDVDGNADERDCSIFVGTSQTRVASGGLAEAKKLGFLLVSAIPWLPFLDTYRTMCVAPEPDFLRMLEEVRGMRIAA